MVFASVGANIAARRRAVGVTQAELAAGIGRSVQWVSAVEQGRRRAERLPDLLRAAAVLDCSVEELIGVPAGTLTSPASLTA
ncbi:MAG: helix-turn-helix domain-containing protein [Mycobacteriales bacterium]